MQGADGEQRQALSPDGNASHAGLDITVLLDWA